MSLMVFLTNIRAQSIERQTIASSGAESSQLSWTIGEPVSGTYEQGELILTQGYQQAYYSISQKIEETAINYNIKVYPNPVRENLFINIPPSAHSYNLEMYDVTGNKVYEQKNVSNKANIKMNQFATSTYFLKIIENGKLVATYKLIREE